MEGGEKRDGVENGEGEKRRGRGREEGMAEKREG